MERVDGGRSVTMSDDITPAMTAEEWRAALRNGFDYMAMLRQACDPIVGNDHRRAALSLYGKSFGFTHEDALRIRGVVKFAQEMSGGQASRSALAALTSIAERIEALLPPTPS
jgi:hypothetical protein